MRIASLACALCAVVGAALSGCESAPVREEVPPFYVPTSAIAQPRGLQQVATIRAEQVLPGSEAYFFYAPRQEPFSYGSTMLGGISAFTDYTFDAQPISTLNGSGYHYRYVVKQGFAAP